MSHILSANSVEFSYLRPELALDVYIDLTITCQIITGHIFLKSRIELGSNCKAGDGIAPDERIRHHRYVYGMHSPVAIGKNSKLFLTIISIYRITFQNLQAFSHAFQFQIFRYL